MGNARHNFTRALVAVGLGAAMAMAPTSPAVAADMPVAIAGFSYVSPVVIAMAGRTVLVTNLDGAAGIPHNIVSQDIDPDTGQPWFRSPVTTSIETHSVAGVAQTPPGVYLFTCDLHAFMTGALVIV